MVRVHSALAVMAAFLTRIVVSALDSLAPGNHQPCGSLMTGTALPVWMVWAGTMRERATGERFGNLQSGLRRNSVAHFGGRHLSTYGRISLDAARFLCASLAGCLKALIYDRRHRCSAPGVAFDESLWCSDYRTVSPVAVCCNWCEFATPAHAKPGRITWFKWSRVDPFVVADNVVSWSSPLVEFWALYTASALTKHDPFYYEMAS